jgi:hypothetical protein
MHSLLAIAKDLSNFVCYFEPQKSLSSGKSVMLLRQLLINGCVVENSTAVRAIKGRTSN